MIFFSSLVGKNELLQKLQVLIVFETVPRQTSCTGGKRGGLAEPEWLIPRGRQGRLLPWFPVFASDHR